MKHNQELKAKANQHLRPLSFNHGTRRAVWLDDVIEFIDSHPTPVSVEGLRDHLLAFVNYLNGNANDDLIYGEQVDTYLYELKNGKGKPFVFFDILTPHPDTTGRESVMTKERIQEIIEDIHLAVMSREDPNTTDWECGEGILITPNEAKEYLSLLSPHPDTPEPNCVGKDFDFGSDELTCTNPDCQDKGACMK
jgi:hypothetical protein